MTQIPKVRQKINIKTKYGQASFTTFENLTDQQEHFALIFNNANPKSVPLVRVHSECMTGDLFKSTRCDCGDQLNEALRLFQKQGGVLIYLRQEGRGIGLYKKIDAYHLQDNGFDTFEANQALNCPHDARDYKVAAEIMEALSIEKINLLTNNPIKASQLMDYGICLEQVIPTGVYVNADNLNYLHAKIKSSNHNIILKDKQ